MKPKLAIYWCRRDFRLTDNPALRRAIDFAKKNQIPLLPIFILDNSLLNLDQSKNTQFEDDQKNNSNFGSNYSYLEKNTEQNSKENSINSGKNPNNYQNNTDSEDNSNQNQISLTSFCNIGLPRRLFLSRVLASFCLKFASFGINFEIFLGNFQSVFEILSDNFELFVFTNQDVEPFSRSRDLVVSGLVTEGNFYSFADQLTISPNLRTGNGAIYSIFTPFKNAGWESFMNSKTAELVEIDKEKSVFVDQNNQILGQIQSLFGQIGQTDQVFGQDLEFGAGQNDQKLTNSFSNLQNLQSLETKQKNYQNISKVLVKKTNFQDLQNQIYDLISANWQFTINKHSKNNSNYHNSPKNNLERRNQSEIIENDDNFVINLENILTKKDYLEWSFEEKVVLNQFEEFLENKIKNYKENRDSLELDTQNGGATSKISTALKWGLVSSRNLKQKIVDKFGLQITSQSGVIHFLNELIWREFYRYILFHEPLVLDTEFQPKFRAKIEEKELENLKEKLSQENIAKFLENL